MKVICIDDSSINSQVIMPSVGEVVTVVGTSIPYPDSYYIKEYPRGRTGQIQSIAKIKFVPLSSIDETEFERNYNLVTLPSNY